MRLVSGVTASQALVEAAVAAGADALLVHHGYFWKGEDPCVTGMKRRRLDGLMGADISLLAYHLPLDAHSELGNNVQLGALFGVAPEGWFGDGRGPAIACYASLSETVSTGVFAERIAAALGREPQFIAGGDHPIHRLGWCTGAAQGYIEAAVALGLDAFISGEISEATVHVARECGIHYFAQDRHRRLRRNPSDRSPVVSVDHQVSDDRDPLPLETVENLLEAIFCEQCGHVIHG